MTCPCWAAAKYGHDEPTCPEYEPVAYQETPEGLRVFGDLDEVIQAILSVPENDCGSD